MRRDGGGGYKKVLKGDKGVIKGGKGLCKKKKGEGMGIRREM